MKDEQIKAIQTKFLEDMKGLNYPKWVAEKNHQYALNLSMAGISHVANGLVDLTLRYAGNKKYLRPFLDEIVEDSLIGAFTTADAVNIQGMAIYCDFVYNVVPKELWINK